MTPMNKQRAYLLLMDKLEPFQNYSQVKFLKGGACMQSTLKETSTIFRIRGAIKCFSKLLQPKIEYRSIP